MRQVTRKGLMTVVAAGGVFALGGGLAHADANADGVAKNSPGVASGNSVQVPVHVPVNACGNTINVIGVLNPAFGNKCANVSKTGGGSGGSSAGGHTSGSPGVGSGNNVQVPVDVPVNACGNSVTVIGAGNTAYGNECENGIEPSTPSHPGEPSHPGNPNNPGNPSTPGNPSNPGTPSNPGEPGHPGTPTGPNTPGTHTITPPKGGSEELAETGAGGSLGLILPAGAGLLLGGAILYRRARASA
ncbi:MULTISPECIES: chaplin [Streptomyces]|uniref:Chaplin family protein n=1 Tax=Streptomyces solicathayae TaxID=3081768 RepID=A0ABZ0M0R0_9ACTN|nr:chaplin family protein [Streptomyces sp. HUAS YS2]WOX25330.1 chaplin family protein [Streptomyces sp. HUAS YS2]